MSTTASPRLPRYSAPAVGPTSVTVAPAARSASSGPVSSRSSNSSSTSIATRLPARRRVGHAAILLQRRLTCTARCHNRRMNRLARERSPYLLQHAHNPVDWFPWGDEAFAKARAERQADLSVDRLLDLPLVPRDGARVVRERRRSPRVLNEHFVSIKVDREERPDVDRVYMTFVQATTGSGGWPMSVWLTPELKPFYGGTYFPPTSRWGRPGLRRHPAGDRPRLAGRPRARSRESAEAVTDAAAGASSSAARGRDGARRRRARARPSTQFRQAFDRAPRRVRRRAEVSAAERAAVPAARARADRRRRRRATWCCATLRAMALGGMRDHIGGGFHRYSVDAAWRVPHFEKMLYDQAQLVLAYVEAAQASGDPFYLEVAEDTLHYVMREMTDADGGFYSAEDADSVPPEQAGEPQRAQDGRRVLPVARRRDRRAARGGRGRSCSRGSASSRTATRRGSAAGVHRQEPAVRRAIGRRARQRTGRPARRGRRESCSRARLRDVRGAARPAAAAPRRQGPHGLERADDCRVRPDGARASRARRRRRAGGRAVSARRPSAPRRSSASACGTPRPARCCGGIATATRRSTATPRTTRT